MRAEIWLSSAGKVMSKSDFAQERSYFAGRNREHTSFREPLLNHPLPSHMLYAIMYDNTCDPGDDFCRRIGTPERRATRSLAAVGAGGRFVRAKGAGHEIFLSNPDLVQKTIDDVLNDTT